MAESSPMTGGDGAYSYAKNSHFQKQSLDLGKKIFEEAILEVNDIKTLLSPSNTLTLTDFGCSVGPNTFFAMQNLIEPLQKKSSKDMEFQVFFNDHTTNDFNTLFASLPPHRNYHAAGVPGSFHARLFPRSSIALAHSSYSIQFLSKVPDGMNNKGRIHYTGASEDVVDAYRAQFERDFGAFLCARGQEIVQGGLMFLIIPVNPNFFGPYFNLLGSTLMDLAHEGVIDESEVDKFNMGMYFPDVEEMRRQIEKKGCFSVERMETIYQSTDLSSQEMITHFRAGLEGTFNKHFHSSVVDKMFNKSLAKAQQISHMEEYATNLTVLFCVLKRK